MVDALHPVAQRVLGHTQLKTTERVYGTLRTRGAQRNWADLLDRKRDALRRSHPPVTSRKSKP